MHYFKNTGSVVRKENFGRVNAVNTAAPAVDLLTAFLYIRNKIMNYKQPEQQYICTYVWYAYTVYTMFFFLLLSALLEMSKKREREKQMMKK